MNDKTSLRLQYRAARQSIDSDTRIRFDAAIRKHLANHEAVANAGVIAAFAAFDGEPDLAPFLAQSNEAGTAILLPVIEPGESRHMSFHRWLDDGNHNPNGFGITEPAGGTPVPLDDIDILLMPLVAWDMAGGRLGMGAGYYDRALAPWRDARQPLRVGVTYACQQAPAIPMDQWDIPLHAVVTENGWFTCPPQAATMNPAQNPTE